MKKTVGLWIDHQKAVVVFVAGKDTEIKLISSNSKSITGNPALPRPPMTFARES